ncbi:MAG TPA: D-2-hydroxyacid dehydrogenase [Paenalcaligenes sp.]|nr:D-2-hydroxyacid dehydrogenase [Paenalcaligenes sp.]
MTQTSCSNYIIAQAHFPGRDINFLIYRPSDAWVFLEQLRSVVSVTVVSSPLEEVAESIEGAVGWHIPTSILQQLTALRWIQTTSSGTDHLAEFMNQAGTDIALSTVRGMNAAVVAEFALMAVLAHKWHLFTLRQQQGQHLWQQIPTIASENLTALVVGLGAIGTLVAGHLQHLGMRVLGVRRNSEPHPAVDGVFAMTRLEDALREADFVVLTVALSEQTRSLIDASALSAMKRSAYVINVSRGEVVDEDALHGALCAGDIAGATLDVTTQEPYPQDGPLWSTPNLFLTPHNAGQRADYAQQAAKIWAENVQRYARGLPPLPAA